MPKNCIENLTKALRREQKQQSKKNRVPQHGRSSLRYRENAERKRNKDRPKKGSVSFCRTLVLCLSRNIYTKGYLCLR